MNYNGFDKDSVDVFLEQVRLGEVEIVELLIQQDIDILIVKNEFGNSALHFACANCNKEMVRALLSHEEMKSIINDKNLQGNTPLLWAVGSPLEMIPGATIADLVEIVKMLLEHGADKTIQSAQEKTALLIAIEKNRNELVELLMDPIPDDIDLDEGELDDDIVVEHHSDK